ncbi:MAG: hypothetical protein CMM93_06855 [Rickettsiales bacterium]|nr:hypothetical protein [Rickettsiales bacterium]
MDKADEKALYNFRSNIKTKVMQEGFMEKYYDRMREHNPFQAPREWNEESYESRRRQITSQDKMNKLFGDDLASGFIPEQDIVNEPIKFEKPNRRKVYQMERFANRYRKPKTQRLTKTYVDPPISAKKTRAEENAERYTKHRDVMNRGKLTNVKTHDYGVAGQRHKKAFDHEFNNRIKRGYIQVLADPVVRKDFEFICEPKKKMPRGKKINMRTLEESLQKEDSLIWETENKKKHKKKKNPIRDYPNLTPEELHLDEVDFKRKVNPKVSYPVRVDAYQMDHIDDCFVIKELSDKIQKNKKRDLHYHPEELGDPDLPEEYSLEQNVLKKKVEIKSKDMPYSRNINSIEKESVEFDERDSNLSIPEFVNTKKQKVEIIEDGDAGLHYDLKSAKPRFEINKPNHRIGSTFESIHGESVNEISLEKRPKHKNKPLDLVHCFKPDMESGDLEEREIKSKIKLKGSFRNDSINKDSIKRLES